MTYVWVFPEEVTNKQTGEYLREVSPDYLLLTDGRFLPEKEFQPIPKVEFEISAKQVQQFDCLANNSGIPIVNQRLRLLLENIASNDVQFLPVTVLCTDRELANYFFVNVTIHVDAVDKEKSKISIIKVPDADDVEIMKKPVYKPNALGEHLFARDREFEMQLLASEKIKTLFEKHKITGAWIVSPQEFYW